MTYLGKWRKRESDRYRCFLCLITPWVLLLWRVREGLILLANEIKIWETDVTTIWRTPLAMDPTTGEWFAIAYFAGCMQA